MAQNHKCQIWGAEFDEAAKLEDRNRTMHSQYTCETCGQVFNSNAELETHNREAHPEQTPAR